MLNSAVQAHLIDLKRNSTPIRLREVDAQRLLDAAKFYLQHFPEDGKTRVATWELKRLLRANRTEAGA